MKGKFIGKTSCGFQTNQIYEIKIFDDKGYIWIKSNNAICPYSSLKTIMDNWIIPFI